MRRRLNGMWWFLLWVVAWLLGLNDVVLGYSERNKLSISSKDSSLAPLHGRSLKSLPPNNNPDTVLVAALDGTVHLVDKDFQRVIWSFASGPPLYSSYQALINQDTEKENSSGSSSGYFIDCGDDWELYAHNEHFGKMKLSLGIEDFIKKTPLISEDGSITLGSRKSTVFEIDALTGRLLRAYGLSDIPSGILNSVEETLGSGKNVKDLVESGSSKIVSVRPLKITRTDYKLQSFAPNSNKIMWNLTVAEIGAALICQDDGKFFSGSPDHLRDQLDYETGDSFTMPLSCHSSVSVYRIRNHDMYRSLLKPQLHNGMQITSPGPKDLLPLLSKIERWFEFRPELMLPLSDSGEHAAGAMVPFAATDVNDFGVTPEHNRRTLYSDALNTLFAPSWILLLIIAIAVIVICVLCYRKGQEKQLVDANQNTPPKKRKIRKSSKSRSPSASIDDGAWMNLNNIVDHVDEGRRIGKLFVSNTEIAKGSNGTIVFEGVYESRAVAVKRLVQAHHDVALKEVQNLITSDQHPNIVRMYGVERDQDFVYLSLERCTCSLDDLIQIQSDLNQDTISLDILDSRYLVEYKVRLDSLKVTVQDSNLWKANSQPSPLLLKLMRDMVSGLAHLHELGIVHRDLKPQNVLIIKERSLCAKLSDMGISKRLQGDMSSLGFQATGCGSSGWQSPEQLSHGRQTRAVDMFSLGCVLFFCVTRGKHPFGDRLERDINIMNNKVDLFLVEFIPEAVDLFGRLLHPKPESRPKALEVLHHPFFWSPETRLSFLRDVSDRVELEDRQANSKILRALESIASVALGGKWDEKVDLALLNDIGKYRRYKYDSVRDLLRVIRNKLNHYRELPKEIKELLGQVPEGFNNYFARRFPRLLIEVHRVICVHCGEELYFQKYFKDEIY